MDSRLHKVVDLVQCHASQLDDICDSVGQRSNHNTVVTIAESVQMCVCL